MKKEITFTLLLQKCKHHEEVLNVSISAKDPAEVTELDRNRQGDGNRRSNRWTRPEQWGGQTETE